MVPYSKNNILKNELKRKITKCEIIFRKMKISQKVKKMVIVEQDIKSAYQTKLTTLSCTFP